MYKILKVKNSTYDVFGPEWKAWCRLKVDQGNRVFFIKGDRFDKDTFSRIRYQLIGFVMKEEK